MFMDSAALHIEQSAESCWWRYSAGHLVSKNVDVGAWILMWPKPHSHKEHVRPFHMPIDTYHTKDFTSPKYYPFKWQCPVSNTVIIPSWFLLRLSNSPAFLVEDLLRKPLVCLCPWIDCQYSSCFLLVLPLITPQQPQQICQEQAHIL